MNKKIISALYKKEITDILRDKKTILMMIVVPLILYPLMFLGSMALFSSILSASTSKAYTVALDGVNDPDAMKQYFKDNEEHFKYTFIIKEPEEGETDAALLEAGTIDAYVAESVSDNHPYFEIAYRASETDSQTAAGMVEKMLSKYRDELRSEAFIEQGLDEKAMMNPIGFFMKDYSSNEENVGFLMGYILPFLLIVSILMGALYPAIDTTAGEKERGTLETLLTLPVNNMELITAKFLAVSTIAVAAAILNLLSMGGLTAFMASSMNMLSDNMNVDLVSFIPSMGVTFICILVFALFASAVSLCSCIMAKSFKEAQNLTTPIMLIFLLGGMAGMIPSLELTEKTALIPVVNITLLIASIFKFHFDLSIIAIVLFSNIAYSALAVVIMTRLFSSEDILFADSAASFRIMEKRADIKKGQIPGMGDLVLLFAILLLGLLFIGGLFAGKFGLWGVIMEQLMFLVITVFYGWYIKVDFKKLFHFNGFNIRGLAGSVLAWAGAYLILVLLSALLAAFFPENADNTALYDLWGNNPVWLAVVSSALAPAICEEVMFRGFMLGTLENKYSAVKAVILTGILFGAYHMSLNGLIIIGLLGIVQSYIVNRTKSIYLTMITHFINNLLAVLSVLYEEQFTKALPFLAGDELPTSTMIIMALSGAVLLSLGMWMVGKKEVK
ncbi:sodium transport system permease protein [Lachnospiraceae bacterium XPB1003]|nr:sodium transport system permease protein [Lachnospiraceae bacterium XPB1003]